MDPAVPSAFIATLPPFQFHSGSTETFNIKGPDIGELIQLTVQVMAMSKNNVCTCMLFVIIFFHFFSFETHENHLLGSCTVIKCMGHGAESDLRF